MSFAYEPTAFSLGTGIATSTKVVPHGLGVIPKFLLLFVVGRTEAVDTTGLATHFRGAGLVKTDGAIVHQCVATMSQHNVATASRNSKGIHRDDAAIVLLTTTGTVDGLASVTAVDATNVTFTINDAFSIDLRVMMVAMGGTDIENVFVGSLVSPTTGTPPFTTDYTTPGFDCADGRALLITIGTKAPTINTGKDDSDFYLGFATSAAMQYAMAVGANNNNATSTQCRRYGFLGESVAQLNAACSDVVGRAQLASFITGGFRQQWNEVAGTANLIGYALIKGPKFSIHTASMSGTNGAQVSVTGAAFQPVGGIVAGTPNSNVQDSSSSDDVAMLGAWSLAAQMAMSCYDDHAAATSVVTTRLEHDNCWCRAHDVTGVANGAMARQTINADGVTYVATESGTNGLGIATVLFGPATVPVSASGVASWESRQGVSAPRGADWEAQAGLSVPRLTAYESQQTIEAARSSAWESLAPAGVSRAADWESLLGLQVPGLAAWESRLGLSRAETAAWESLLGVVGGAEPSWESWRIQVLLSTLLRMRVTSGPLFRMEV